MLCALNARKTADHVPLLSVVLPMPVAYVEGYRLTFSTTIITVKTTSNVEFVAVDSLQKLKHTVGTSPPFFARVQEEDFTFLRHV